MPFKQMLFFVVLISFACNDAPTPPVNDQQNPVAILPGKNTYATTGDIPLPAGFTRVASQSHSFAGWLRKLGLKEDRTVYLFDGNKKKNQLAQFAVLDVSVSNKNLQQCADAVMRLRAEYLFAEKRFDEIIFTDNEQGIYTFGPPFSRQHFMSFMEKVFGMCGSASLSKQLKPVADVNAIEAGNVFIRGGFPGHAAIVTDVASNAAGKKIFMLAQSYMPAQDIHVLLNPAGENINPWYEVNDLDRIVTPEYVFYTTELKQW
jgi:Domain of unknown function (4846)